MRRLGGALLAALVVSQVCTQGVAAPAGESIYRQGILPSGQPLTARREPDLPVSGIDAACTNCHRRSDHVADSFMRDYLVERVEGMLEHRIITGYYPRLALAPNERFASKGGYIVHFAQPSGAQVSADTDWFVP